MADKKTPAGNGPEVPLGTVPPPTGNPELIGLRESEAAFIEKGKRLEGMDANEQSQGGVDLQEVKRNNDKALANVRKRIQRLTK